jgi:prophage regulatory protein
MAATSENPTRFLRLPQVKHRTGFSRSSIYAKVALGQFPAPVNLGARAVAWIDSEIEEWIRNRVEASRSGMSSDRASR